MSGGADLIADLLTNGVALAALLIAVVALRRGRSAPPVERRLRRLLIGLAGLLALRMVNWVAPQPLLAIPVTVIASWLPLLALRLVEELLRRHAPPMLKRAALAGAIGLSAAALLTGAFFPRALMTALAIFQAALLLWTVLFLARERAHELAVAETRLADTFGFALLLAIPFALSDFRGTLPGLPVRMGGLGALVFVLATSRIASGTGAPRLLLFDLLGILLCGGGVAAAAWLLLPAVAPSALWQLFAIAAAAAAALLIVQRQDDVRRAERRRPSIIAALAALPDDAAPDALIAAHPLTASGTLIGPAALDLYDHHAVAGLAEQRVVGPATPATGAAEAAARNLLAEHAASHLVRLSRNPPQFLALNAGQIGGTAMLDLQLDMLARLADRERP